MPKQEQRGRSSQLSFESEDLCAEALCYQLFAEAEKVRWRAADIPWDALDRARVSPALLGLVREAALSELTTHSAARRFLQEFADDVDFTQWIAVWFYEESTHPQVLMQWLHCFGERCSAEFVRRGRQSAPFMRSRFGTLVTNIISETIAAHNYLTLHRAIDEPVLAAITKNLASDEARHARGFFAYARRMLERSEYPDLERLDGLKVLHLWFAAPERVTHPVSEFLGRTTEQPPIAALVERFGLDPAVPAQKACRLIGSLLGLRIDSVEAVEGQLSELRARVEKERVMHAAP